MSKWHNGKNGPGLCKAVKGKCPFGESSEHFDSKESAQEAFDIKNEEEFGLISMEKQEWQVDTSSNDESGETWVRNKSNNTYEFFQRVSSTDGYFHTLSKGEIDISSSKINQKAVEKEFKVKKKDNPSEYAKAVINYYGGDNFDNNPTYVNSRRTPNYQKVIDKEKEAFGIPLEMNSAPNVEKKSESPWDPNNKASWRNFQSYNSIGDSSGETMVRPSVDGSKIEFFSSKLNNSGSQYVVSKGTIDLKEVNQSAVEDFSGNYKDEDENSYYNSVVEYYDGQSFDSDPIHISSEDEESAQREIDSIKEKFGMFSYSE